MVISNFKNSHYSHLPICNYKNSLMDMGKVLFSTIQTVTGDVSYKCYLLKLSRVPLPIMLKIYRN